MRNIFFSSVFILVFVNSFGQSIYPEIIPSSGGSISNSQYFVDWTFGETVIETITDTNNILTQGFQQPDFYLVSIIELSDFSIDVFPNPAFQKVNIKSNADKKFNVAIYNLSGAKIKDIEFFEETIIDISELSKSVYLIKITDQENESVKILKLIKAR